MLRTLQNISFITRYSIWTGVYSPVFCDAEILHAFNISHYLKLFQVYFVHKLSFCAFTRMTLFIMISESMYESCKPLPVKLAPSVTASTLTGSPARCDPVNKIPPDYSDTCFLVCNYKISNPEPEADSKCFWLVIIIYFLLWIRWI